MNEENRNIQTSLAGGGINEEEKLRQAKKAEMQKKYRIMSVGLVAVIVVAIVLLASNRNGNSPEIKQDAGTENTTTYVMVDNGENLNPYFNAKVLEVNEKNILVEFGVHFCRSTIQSGDTTIITNRNNVRSICRPQNSGCVCS